MGIWIPWQAWCHSQNHNLLWLGARCPSLPESRVPTPATLCVPPSRSGTGTLLQKGHSGSRGVSRAELCVGLGLHFPSPDNSGSSPFGLPDVPRSCCHLLSQGRSQHISYPHPASPGHGRALGSARSALSCPGLGRGSPGRNQLPAGGKDLGGMRKHQPSPRAEGRAAGLGAVGLLVGLGSQAPWSREPAFLDLLKTGPTQLRAPLRAAGKAKSQQRRIIPSSAASPPAPHTSIHPLFHELQQDRSSWKS